MAPAVVVFVDSALATDDEPNGSAGLEFIETVTHPKDRFGGATLTTPRETFQILAGVRITTVSAKNRQL